MPLPSSPASRVASGKANPAPFHRLRQAARLVLLALAACPGPTHAEALPVFDPSGPDAAAYGSTEGYPAGYPQTQRTLIGNFSHYDSVSRTRPVPRGPDIWAFIRAPQEIDLRYTHQGQAHTIPDYLSRHPATGLLLIKDNVILAEHYQYGRTDTDRFMSQSMAKTVLAMLIGIAVAEGHIRSIDDPAQTYLPSLAGSEIGATPLRAPGCRKHCQRQGDRFASTPCFGLEGQRGGFPVISASRTFGTIKNYIR